MNKNTIRVPSRFSIGRLWAWLTGSCLHAWNQVGDFRACPKCRREEMLTEEFGWIKIS